MAMEREDRDVARRVPGKGNWTLAGLALLALVLIASAARAEIVRLTVAGDIPLTWPNGIPRPIPKPAPGFFENARQGIDVSLSPSDRATFADLYARLPRTTPAPGASALTAPGRPLPLALGAGGNVTFAPTLNFGAATAASPYDPRIAAPQAQHLNPTPGLNASMALGNVTVDTLLNRPLRANADNLIAPDGKPAAAQPNMGVDLRLKF
jgi:hypothetical protein